MTATTEQMPAHLVEAIEAGELTEEQIHEIIEFQARQLGLMIDEAYELDRQRALPKTPVGSDLHFWIRMLAPLPASAGQ